MSAFTPPPFTARFGLECEALSHVVRGLPPEQREEYAALLLHRLMFMRFLQAKDLLPRGGPGREFFRESRWAGVFAAGQPAGVEVSAAAFARVEAFFEEYEWSLSEAPDALTPALLGPLFEKHINRKEQGAYYTKDDVTAYLASRTIVPFLLDAVGELPWHLLSDAPDRYISAAIRSETPLPTETRAEEQARHRRCQGLRKLLRSGAVRAVNELVTLHLDLERFAVDAITSINESICLKLWMPALRGISVFDPTCGSGVFLVAALRVLERLWLAAGQTPQDARRHILSHNLFGVDLMPEAVELCRMRLLLEFAAVSEGDTGFGDPASLIAGIQAGNIFSPLAPLQSIGCSTRTTHAPSPVNGAFRVSGVGPSLRAGDPKRDGDRVLDTAKPAVNDGPTRSAKSPVNGASRRFLRCVDTMALRKEGSVPGSGAEEVTFDIVLGNPPYLPARGRRRSWAVAGYRTAACPDVYAWVLERSAHLLRPGGRCGMIVPLSLGFSSAFAPCRELLFDEYGDNWFASFGRIPAALFAGDVRVRNVLHIGHKSTAPGRQHTTRLHRWFEAARPHLLQCLEYAPFEPAVWGQRVPRFNTPALGRALENCLQRSPARLADALARRTTAHVLHFKKTAYNWLNFCRQLPDCFDAGGLPAPQTQYDSLHLADPVQRDLALLFLNGKWAFAFWCIVGDDFHVARWMFGTFPIDLGRLPETMIARLRPLARELEEAMIAATSFKRNAGKRVGTYNLARCRPITDQSDRLFAEALGLTNVWDDMELLLSQVVKTEIPRLPMLTASLT